MSQPTHSLGEEADIRRIVESLHGETPAEVRYMAAGGMSRTFEAVLPGGQALIVRTNAAPTTFETTSRNIEALRGLGLPVPRVLATALEPSDYPFSYMVLESIPGRDLRYELGGMSRPQMTALAERLVGYQKEVGGLPPGSAYGYAGIGQRAPSLSWADVVPSGYVAQTAPGTDLLSVWRASFSALTERYRGYLESVPPTCFLDDITVKNVIMKDGELQGLIDFDCVCYGDPLWWIGLTAAGVVGDVGSGSVFYVDELRRAYGLTPEQGRIVSLYSAMHAAGFVTRADELSGPEWSERMRTHIDAWISEAEGS